MFHSWEVSMERWAKKKRTKHLSVNEETYCLCLIILALRFCTQYELCMSNVLI